MMTTYVQRGESIDYTPGADVAAGQVVVQGELVGVATRPIATGELGALTVEGVFDFAKASGAGTNISAGSKVYWDVGDEEATMDPELGANKYIGKAIANASDDDATVRARMSELNAAAAPILLSADYDTGGPTLTLTFDQVLDEIVAITIENLVVHTGAINADDWTINGVIDNVVTLEVSGSSAASGAAGTLDWLGEADVFEATATGLDWQPVTGFPVTIT